MRQKGYRLEDAETGKIITARDVRFVEDDTPGDLAVIETRGVAPTRAEIDALGPREVEKAVESAVPNAPTSPEEISTAQQGDSAPGPSTPDQPETSQEVQQPKPSKWASLPPREHPRRERKPAALPGEPMTEDEFSLSQIYGQVLLGHLLRLQMSRGRTKKQCGHLLRSSGRLRLRLSTRP